MTDDVSHSKDAGQATNPTYLRDGEVVEVTVGTDDGTLDLALLTRAAPQLLDRSGARVLVAAGPELDAAAWQAALALARNADLDAILVLRPTGATSAAVLPAAGKTRVAYLSQLAQDQDSDEFVGTEPTGSDLAGLFQTGGTTGLPKLAAHAHANEVADAWMLSAATATPRSSRASENSSSGTGSPR